MIPDLPTELQLEIFICLDRQDLANIRLCNHALNKSARIQYYEYIDILLTQESSVRKVLHSLKALTDLFAVNPSIAPLIRVVRLDGFSVFQRLRAIEEERKRIVVSQPSDPILKVIYHESKAAEIQSAIASFLLQVPNLRHLSAKHSLIFQPFWGLTIQRFTSLRTLRYVSPKLLEHGCVPLALDPALFRALSELPNLQHLILGGRDYASTPDWSTSSPNTAPQLAALKSMHLDGVYIREETLGLILSTAPALTSLSVWMEPRADPDSEEMRSPFLDCDALRLALMRLPHPERLEELTLRVAWWTTGDVELRYGGGWEKGRGRVDWGIRGAIGDIRFLTRMRVLSVAPPVLFGWEPESALAIGEVLPASVEEVKFTNDMYDWNYREYGYKWSLVKWVHTNRIATKGTELLDHVGRWRVGDDPKGLKVVIFEGADDTTFPERRQCERAFEDILVKALDTRTGVGVELIKTFGGVAVDLTGIGVEVDLIWKEETPGSSEISIEDTTPYPL